MLTIALSTLLLNLLAHCGPSLKAVAQEEMVPEFIADPLMQNDNSSSNSSMTLTLEKDESFKPLTINNSCLTYRSIDTIIFHLTFVELLRKHDVNFYLMNTCNSSQCSCFILKHPENVTSCSEENDVSENCKYLEARFPDVLTFIVEGLTPATNYSLDMTPYVCISDTLFNATRQDIGPFSTITKEEQSEEKLKDIIKDFKNKTVGEILQNVTDILMTTNITSSAVPERAADVLKVVSQTPNISIPDVKKTLEAMSLAADLFHPTSRQANQSNNFTNVMVATMEQLTDHANLMQQTSVSINTDAIFVRLRELDNDTTSWPLGLKLTEDRVNHSDIFQSVSSLTDHNIDTGIWLPLEILEAVRHNTNKTIKMSTSIISNTSIFTADARRDVDSEGLGDGSTDPHAPSPTAVLYSRVVFMRLTVDSNPVNDLSLYGDGHVSMLFTPLEKPQGVGPEITGKATCVFWDVGMYGRRGGWSTHGCILVSSFNGRHECSCDHLTNFALLMDYYQIVLIEPHANLLGLISKIFLGLSVAGLSLTALSFVLVKPLRQKVPQQTLFNLVIAMMTSLLIFLTGFENAVGSKAACVTVGALLHYSILATFTWMLAMGILQYLMVTHGVRLKGALDRFTWRALIPAWGSPAVPVIAVLAYNVDLYYSYETHCWLDTPALYYAFIGPAAVIIVINLVVYLNVMNTVCRRKEVSSGGVAYNVVSARASLGAFVSLGLSWTFAFLAIAEARVVFQYLFVISTALQGFLIFLLFTARERAVQDYWKKVFALCRRRESRGSSYSMQSPGSRQVLKHPSSLSDPSTEDTYEG